MRKTLANWGRYPVRNVEVITSSDLDAFRDEASMGLTHDSIARGMGRCYGDASLAERVIDTTSWNRILDFNPKTHQVHCEAGVTLDQLLTRFVPEGFFLPVTPGTKFITVGGALASDIHGKNHHVDGVFSDHVLRFTLITPGGKEVTAEAGDGLFERTAGGMGTTGIITTVTFQLRPITSSYIRRVSIPTSNLTDTLNAIEAHPDSTYSVAWVDVLARGKNRGRGVLYLGEHAQNSEVKGKALRLHRSTRLTIPRYFPSFLLNRSTMRWFNTLYYHKPSSRGQDIVHYDPYFYPLDRLHHWNRMYGKRGFIQWQCVIPKERSRQVLDEVLTLISEAGIGSFLAVIKLFGKSHTDRHLHFPMEGYTLSVDIRVTDRTFAILDNIDELISKAGGKTYLAKDARLNKKNFKKQYSTYMSNSEELHSYQTQRLNEEQRNSFLILGANSDIARATALQFLKENSDGYLMLASRNKEATERFIAEHHIGDRAEAIHFDATAFDEHAAWVQRMPHLPKWILYAAGTLTVNEAIRSDPNEVVDHIGVNYTGAVSILTHLVNSSNPFLEHIVAISSVAGIRGRRSNYYYGSAKSGLHQFMSGLRQDLKERNIRVTTVTPGFVKSKMTEHLDLPGFANTPEEVARCILKGRSGVAYPSLFWRMLSFSLRFMPEWLLARLS